MISAVGQFYDGKQPVARAVQVLGDERGLQILSAEDGVIFWDYDNLREQGSDLKPDRMIVSPADDPSQFLSFEHEALVAMVRTHAKKYLQKNFSVTPAWAVKVWASLGAVAVTVLLLMYVVIPWTSHHIAPVLPYRLEANLGQTAEATFLDFLGKIRQLSKDDAPIICDGNVEPLQALMGDLQQAITDDAADNGNLRRRVGEIGVPSVKIVNSPVVNAVALPGGRILVFRGLLEEAVSDFDSLGFILAHEAGHVMYRHNMQLVISHSAVMVLLQSLVGDLLNSPGLGDIAGIAVVSDYTLEMEKQADELAVGWSKGAGLNPARASEFFQYVSTPTEEKSAITLPPEIADIFATHPAGADRMAFLQANDTNTIASKYGDYDEWLAELQTSCPAPKQKK